MLSVNGKVYIFGGTRTFAQSERFDLSKNSWQYIAPKAFQRTSCTIYVNFIYIVTCDDQKNCIIEKYDYQIDRKEFSIKIKEFISGMSQEIYQARVLSVPAGENGKLYILYSWKYEINLMHTLVEIQNDQPIALRTMGYNRKLELNTLESHKNSVYYHTPNYGKTQIIKFNLITTECTCYCELESN